MVRVISAIGRYGINLVQELGRMGLFFYYSFLGIFKPPGKFFSTIKQVHFIGNKSMAVVSFTAAFSGMVLGLQGYYTLSKFGSEGLLGSAVALSLIRELGPVLTALMVTGRAGSAICAEIGIMRIEEQIEALECMAIDPYSYIIAPKVLGCIIAVPLLTAIFDIVGMLGGYGVGVGLMGVNPGAFIWGMKNSVLNQDVWMGVVKSFFFAVLIIWICCYKGFWAGTRRGSFGAEGVSKATTEAVVLSSVMVLVCDYIITSLML